MLEAAAAVHGIDPQLEQTALIRAFEYCLPLRTPDPGGHACRAGPAAAGGCRGRRRDGRRPAARARGPHPAAVRRSRPGHAGGRRHPAGARGRRRTDAPRSRQRGPDHGAVGSPRPRCLPAAGRRVRPRRPDPCSCSTRPCGSCRWPSSAAGRPGGPGSTSSRYASSAGRSATRPSTWSTPRTWPAIGAPRAQVEAIAEAMRQLGFGGVHASAVAALAVRDLAEGPLPRRLSTG